MTDCATPPITFDPAAFRAEFPEFANCSDGQLSGWFSRATLFCANSVTNPAFCVGILGALLNLATAHVGWLNAPRDASGNPASQGQPAPALVGRIGNATEGSVSVGVEWKDSGSPSEAWFVQTKYGAEFWQATAQFRTARYFANPTVVPGTRPPGWPAIARLPFVGRRF